MSRRKQARPIRHLESEDGLVSSLPNEESSGSCSEDDGHDGDVPLKSDDSENYCRNCHLQFLTAEDYLIHSKACEGERLTGAEDTDEMAVSGAEEDDEEENGKQLEAVRRQRQDEENNNSGEGDGDPEEPDAEMPLTFPTFPLAGHVTLEALQNTKVAVAQFAATAMANNTDNAAALQELAVLQSTLFTLQHQQVMQLSLIQQLQRQLQITRSKEGSPVSPPPAIPPIPIPPTIPLPIQQPASPEKPPPKPETPPPKQEPIPPPVQIPPTTQSIPSSHSQQLQRSSTPPASNSIIIPKPPACSSPAPVPPPPPPSHLSMCSISSSLASSIITNTDPPPLNEPNTLEMLQRRAQEVLDSASQGLLANNLADELAFRKGGKSVSPYDGKGGRNEPFFKHRCRYCGKVFGSDSALQIHIRSHTGERPYKCNVCGSRFTTKGNLKVHFQRHTAKFPHVKMNPNPVPEHLDKYHPPLLAQLGSHHPSISPGLPPHPHHPAPPPPPHPHHPFHPGTSFPPTTMTLYRPPPPPPHDLISHQLHTSQHRPLDPQHVKPLLPHSMFGHRIEQELPENLSKPTPNSFPSPQPIHSDRCKKEPQEDEQHSENDRLSPKREPEIDQEPEVDQEHETDVDHMDQEQEMERYSSPTQYDDCSLDSKYSNEDMLMEDPESPEGDKIDDSFQDQPENLSNKVATSTVQTLAVSIGQRLPPSFPFPHTVSPPSSASSGSANTSNTPLGPFPPEVDPAKDPAIYTNLLPRPGSNDNSWESLIEVTKTSETSKLQQLVDNIEHKLTDPNQCVICHRVLSCKSALQMHYRTHTGERPFKCKICGRAFTTKGNLKTHMGVHRAKPPMRVLHQCPVCHKKFTNALVLQQHIRLHTGEPTDLTPEQIQAAEIKDYPPPGAFPIPNSMSPFLPHGFPIPGISPIPPPGIHFGLKPEFEDRRDREREFKDDFLDDDNSNSSGDTSQTPSFSTSLAALENQVRTITTQSAPSLSRSPEELRLHAMSFTPTPVNGDKSPVPTASGSPSGSEARGSPSPPRPTTPLNIPRPPSSLQQPDSPAASESNSLGALDLTPRATTAPSIVSGVVTGFGIMPPSRSSPLSTSALSSLTSSVLNSTAFSPIGLTVGPAVRPGNTTCNLCFKTFACNSALEIHYRSHTKERPFKCTVCDRGFSTKDDTDPHHAKTIRHCICDQWGQWRIQRGDSGDWGNETTLQQQQQHSFKRQRNRNEKNRKQKGGAKKYTARLPPLPLLDSPGYAPDWNPFLGNMKQHMLTHKIRDMPSHLFEPNKPPPPLPPPPPQISHNSNDDCSSLEDIRPPSVLQHENPMKPDLGPAKRSPPEGENMLPIPKRQPGMPKHLCTVCNKNFSSSSALQIHMRTHTGDKPFRCTICQKAFTTKGNLKVHMGTHMWSNGVSRRGRRMSLDLPPIPMTPKDSEFLQRRPDLFYPYIPAPFLNGMQQKLNEISVIQSVNSSSGLSPPGGKYASLLGFATYHGDKSFLPEPEPESPLSDKHSSSPPLPLSLSLNNHHNASPQESLAEREEAARSVWDLHYERKSMSEDHMAVSPPPPGHMTPHRGEGLAA